jgi:hypothetical protein
MKRTDHVPSPITARELLVSVAGEEHAEHTVMRKEKRIGVLAMWCSCGAYCTMLNTEANRLALRNVAEVES